MQVSTLGETTELGAPARGSMYRFDGLRLNMEILARGKSIPGFAAYIGMTPSTVYNACHGRLLHVRNAVRISNGLESLEANPTMESLSARPPQAKTNGLADAAA
jgi:hypothetical protein